MGILGELSKLLPLVGIFPALVAAAPAHADPADTAFLADLDRNGIWYTTADGIIGYAHGVCTEMSNGMRRYAIADLVLRDNPKFGTWENADKFVIIANDHYCPWLEPPEPSPGAPPTILPGAGSGVPPPPAVASDSLPVGVPITHPACDGTGIAVVGNAITPGRYAADVQQLLTEFPGSSYLLTKESCSSLRQASDAGNPIYAVYRVAGRTQEEVCTSVRAAGGNAYGKWLDNTTDPSDVIPC